MNKIIKFSFILLITTALGIGAYFAIVIYKKRLPQNETAVKVGLPSTETPPLYPNLVWKGPVRPAPPNDYFVYDENDEPVQVSGEEWIAVTDLNSSIISSFQQYYESQLKPQGWTDKVYVGNKKITALVADGPTGSSLGYVLAKDSKVRTLIISETWPPATEEGTVELRVFLSDWLKISN